MFTVGINKELQCKGNRQRLLVYCLIRDDVTGLGPASLGREGRAGENPRAGGQGLPGAVRRLGWRRAMENSRGLAQLPSWRRVVVPSAPKDDQSWRKKTKKNQGKKTHVPAQLNPQRKTTSFKKEKLLKIVFFFTGEKSQ